MLPNKGMALRWFISHIGAFIGIPKYIVLAFFFYSVYPSLLIVCLIVAGFGLIINLGIFIHRNEYSRREYRWCMLKQWINMLDAVFSVSIFQGSRLWIYMVIMDNHRLLSSRNYSFHQRIKM